MYNVQNFFSLHDWFFGKSWFGDDEERNRMFHSHVLIRKGIGCLLSLNRDDDDSDRPVIIFLEKFLGSIK